MTQKGTDRRPFDHLAFAKSPRVKTSLSKEKQVEKHSISGLRATVAHAVMTYRRSGMRA